MCVSAVRQHHALPVVSLMWNISTDSWNCAPCFGYSFKSCLIKELNQEFYHRFHVIESTCFYVVFLQILRFTSRSVLQNNTRVFTWGLRVKRFTHFLATIVCCLTRLWFIYDIMPASEYNISFPRIKRPGRGVDHTPPPSAQVKGRVELFLYFPSGPSSRVIGWKK